MKRFSIITITLLLALNFVMPTDSYGQTAAEKKKQELMKKLQKLQAKKAAASAAAKADADKRDQNTNVGAIIAQYENYYNKNCKTTKSNRCADALYSLSKNYYKKAKDDFVKGQERYEIAITKWEKNPIGPEPIPVIPDYSKSLNSYKKAVVDYPNAMKVAEGYFQIGSIELLNGSLDASKEAYLSLVKKKPNDVRSAAAHFRIADICFADRDYTCALEHLMSMDEANVTGDIKEMAHFRKGEIYYNRGDFDKSAEVFGTYIDRADKKIYQKGDLRGEALEYLAVSFSDMDNGADQAIAYFSKKGNRTYEDTVIYRVGMKNYDHGQYEQATKALSRAIEKFPNYVDAPLAQTNIVYSYVIRKKQEEANKARVKLVDTYGKGSPWILSHASDPKVVAKADEEVKKSLGSIAIFFHAKAQASKEPEKQLAWYKQALKRYLQFVKQYPEDKWKVYEYTYNAAEAFSSLKNYEKAAKLYIQVASADLSKFPKFKVEIDTVGLDQQEIEKLKQERKKSPVDISQEDAGFNAIVSLNNLRKQKVKVGKLDKVASYALPITKQFIDYIHAFQIKFPKSKNAAEVLYLAATVQFDGKDFPGTIAECQSITAQYGSKPEMFSKASKLLADAYTENAQYDLAIAQYDTLISMEKSDTEEKRNLIVLASGAIFKKAEMFKAKKLFSQAATEFKGLTVKYPTSVVVDKAWFAAATCYESADNRDSAAITFKQLTVKFPKSPLVEKSFVRASENYEKQEKWAEAGGIMELAAEKVQKADFAIPSLSKASGFYTKAGKDEKAADMFYMAYKRYPTDKRTPTALYNAGRAYEKGKNYTKAIEVYKLLASKYAEDKFASEGYYSIGFCYKKMKNKPAMANAFVDYANKFSSDRPKQIEALLYATEAYQEMNDLSKAETNVRLATKIYDKYHKKASIDPGVGAKVFYILGELNSKKISDIKLKGKNQKAVQKQLDIKVKALKPALGAYAQSIKQGVEEWTIRSTYAVARIYVEFAEDIKSQQIFGSAEQKIAAKIGIVSGLEKYYDKAIEKLVWIIETANKQGISNKYVKDAESTIMEMGFRKGRLLEEVGEIFRDAPIPKGMTDEDQMAYREILDEKYFTALDAALPKYSGALEFAKKLHIGHNSWVDSIKSRIEYIDPNSEAMAIDLDAERAKSGAANVKAETAADKVNKDLDAALARISNVISSDISVEDKITRLTAIEMDAKRIIADEDELISGYKKQLGLK